MEAGLASLQELRAEIDSVDDEVVDLLARRVELCRAVGAAKRKEGIAVMQEDRVREVRDRCLARASERSLDRSLVARVYDLLIDYACDLEADIAGESPATAEAPTRLGRSAVGIDHVAIAVRDLREAIAHFEKLYGFELVEEREVEGSFSGMASAVMKAGGITFVLVQGTSPASNVSQYIEHYGPGIQHVALEVDDIQGVFDDLEDRSCDLLTGVIRAPGLSQVFTRRDANSGIQVEIIQRMDNAGFAQNNIEELFRAMERENVF